jgi:hypothetical protein
MENHQATNPKPFRRWFHPTPGRLLVVLLAVEGGLMLSERFQWFSFNEHKGWTVLIAMAALGLFLLFMLVWFVFALLFRRRFQFSIRSLLVLTIVVAIPFSWFAVEMKWAREQKETVEAFRKLGNGVGYDYQYDYQFKAVIPNSDLPGPAWLHKLLGDDFFANVVVVNLGDPKVTDAALVHLKGLTQLKCLYLNDAQVTDAGLEDLKGLMELQTLWLLKTKVTDAGLEHLKGLKQLQCLFLGNTQVTDAGLEHLKGLEQLQLLYIHDTQITDDGLKHLKGLTNLIFLDLNNTAVTDVGLEHIKGLTILETLNLGKTKVTDAGVNDLQKALPNLKIDR